MHCDYGDVMLKILDKHDPRTTPEQINQMVSNVEEEPCSVVILS